MEAALYAMTTARLSGNLPSADSQSPCWSIATPESAHCRISGASRWDGSSSVADEALRRMARIWRLEREFAGMDAGQRLAARQELAKPLWQDLLKWLQLERARVADGGAAAKAIDFSLNNWQALTRNLHNGDVPVSNNHLENLMRPWAVERKAWLFCGSELAGQRAAMVTSLLQSANCAATIRMPNCVTCCSACPSIRLDFSTNCCRTVGNRWPDRVRLDSEGAAAVPGCLDGRTFLCAIGAEHTAVPRLRAQQGPATLALVEPLARVGRHGFSFAVSTLGTGER